MAFDLYLGRRTGSVESPVGEGNECPELYEIVKKTGSIEFLACEKDTFTTVDEMRELFSVVPVEKKTFTVFNGASHLMANAKDKKLYQRVLKTKRCQVC